MKIAVTGASGYLGRHVIRALTERGDATVIAGVRSAPDSGNPANEVEWVLIELADTGGCFDRLGRPDLLIHLAWGGLPNYRSLHHFETELPQQYAFLKAMVEQGLGAMLVTGTCFEYGMQSGQLSEDCAIAPTNPYGHAKAALNSQLRFLQHTQQFALAWTRLFYSFGPGQAPTSIYAQFTAALDRGDRAFPMSRGEQLRDFMPIQQLAADIVDLAWRRCDEDVNVCSGTPTSIRALVEGWREERGGSIRLDLGRYPYPDYEPLAFWGSRRRLTRILGET